LENYHEEVKKKLSGFIKPMVILGAAGVLLLMEA
jgi:hypothetical protein